MVFFCFFLLIFAADISKKALKGSSLDEFSLLILSFFVKTKPQITRGGFYYVYGSTKCFETVNNVTGAISIAPN